MLMRMRKILSVVGLSAVLLGPGLAAAAAEQSKEEAIRDSVVKIYSSLRPPDLIKPWQKQTPQEATGTGIVIEGKRILTNAHVVSYASQVFVEPNQSGEKLAATVEFAAPGIDLAVLKLEDESFFDKRPPLPRAEKLPEIKESVTVYGYPTGGSSLSITKGIVSRIEFVGYGAHTQGLRIQIDAAVNPGNSGGPAMVDDRMIGLTFSGVRGADNIGYIIPTEEVDLFLQNIADGKYEFKPMMGGQLQTLENEALRAKLGFQKKSVGVVVHEPESTDPGSPLKKWDVITKIGDHDVDNVFMAKVRDGLRVDFKYFIQKLAKDGKVPMTIVRDGKEQVVEVPVTVKADELLQSLRGRYPSYFIYGPLVFSVASAEFSGAIDQRSAAFLGAIGNPMVTRRGEKMAFPGEELVIISSPMFPHRIGKGYGNPMAKVVKDVNGTKIKSLKHLVETLRDSKEKYITLTFDDRNSETIVFDRLETLRATDEILSDNSVRQQASEDIAPIWSKKD
jgi:S1-C subfamily serine protease